jgi:methanogenic corrinoid protein MtbC1
MSISPRALAAYWDAVSVGDGATAHAVVDEVLREGAGVTDVLFGLVMPTQVRVGQCWAESTWSIANEHAATAVSESVVLTLGNSLPEPRDDSRPLLVACPEREWHALPALVVAQALRASGHSVHYLGASTSGSTIVGRVLDLAPRAVLLSASLSSSLPRVRRQIEAVRGTGTPVVVGGSAFDVDGVRAHRLGATAYATTVEGLLEVLAQLPVTVPPAPPLRDAGALEAQAISVDVEDITRDVIAWTDHRLGISGGGEDAVAPDDWRVVLATHVAHIVGCVAGSLLVEDPRIMSDARSWLQDVLAHRDADPVAVDTLWSALRDRLREYPEASRLLGA